MMQAQKQIRAERRPLGTRTHPALTRGQRGSRRNLRSRYQESCFGGRRCWSSPCLACPMRRTRPQLQGTPRRTAPRRLPPVVAKQQRRFVTKLPVSNFDLTLPRATRCCVESADCLASIKFGLLRRERQKQKSSLVDVLDSRFFRSCFFYCFAYASSMFLVWPLLQL